MAERTAELQILAERLQLATAAGGIGVWEWDIQTNRLIWDARMLALYGARESEFDGSFTFWTRMVNPEDMAQAQGGLARTLHGDSRFNTEFRIRWPDGSIRWMAAFGKAVCDAQGQPQRMIGVNWDISERKQAEADGR